MSISDQIKKVKENWLIICFILLLMVFNSGLNLPFANLRGGYSGVTEHIPMAEQSLSGKRSISIASDFAPEIEKRVILKTTSLNNEVKRDTFKEEELRLKGIIKDSGSFILKENVNRYGSKMDDYFSGSYKLKVSSIKYDIVIDQLKELGEVKSFSENEDDVTGSYADSEMELETEKSRLIRYQKLYNEAVNMEDKINLNDRLFDQERKIKYMEGAIDNVDRSIEYITIYFSMIEKKSSYSGLNFVKFSELIVRFVNSFSSLVSLLFVLLPWGIAFLIGKFVYVKFKK